ncbi:urotensin-2 [Manis pentadactyla]|uniref:urotensin-2 n=1 Tax=Manis pentadactyla TaxID=143292 RepID=UPI00255CD83B|nr:urotensin-2 [Manis pentadactyla]KAI5139141.1 Urotensin-2 [Manis pentadactyla]
MHKLASCCLLFIGCLHPLLSLPVPDSRKEALLLSAPDGEARSALDDLERASLRQALWEKVSAETGDGLRKADLRTNIFNPRGSMRKFQAFSQEAPNISLGHILATIRKQSQKRGPPSECFWKYCV